MTVQVYYVRHAIYAPAILSLVSLVIAMQVSWWFLAAAPFTWLGSVCSAPNCNLADGCLAYVALIIGIVVFVFSKPLGVALIAGIISGYALSVVEKTIRLQPWSIDERTQD